VALLGGGGGVMQLPWAAVSKGQQGKTKIKKIDLLCLTHFKLFSQIK